MRSFLPWTASQIVRPAAGLQRSDGMTSMVQGCVIVLLRVPIDRPPGDRTIES
jgi:hypothetical protein